MSIVYLLVIWVPLITIAVVFGVDQGTIMLARSQLATAADAASMAAASGLKTSPSEARLRAKEIASQNFVGGKPLVLLDSDIEIGWWDSNTHTFTNYTGSSEANGNAVRVNAKLAATRGSGLKLAFQGMVTGHDSVDLQKSAVGQVSMSTANDLVLVQDVTGSFTDEISYARTGDQALLDSLNNVGGSTRFGIVGFTGVAVTVSPLLTVKNSYTTLSGDISLLQVGGASMPSTDSCTDIAAGIENAISVFEAATPSKNKKAMLIVSDGECVASPNNAHPGLTSDELLTLAQQDADSALAKGIDVYVVYWDSANNPASEIKLQSLIRGNGTYVHVTDLSQLASTIGSQVINSTYLVK